MSYPLLSLVADAPEGFEHRAELPPREVRRGPFALFAPTLEAAQEALGSLLGRVVGIVVTCGQSYALEKQPNGLHHMTIPATLLRHARAFVEPCLGFLSQVQHLSDHDTEHLLELNRAAEDRTRLVQEFAQARASLLRGIEERRVAEQALRESEEQFRATFEMAAVGMVQADASAGRLLRVNAKFCEILGYSHDELMGRTVQEITYPEDRTLHLDLHARLLRAEISEYAVEKRYLRKDGGVIWGQVNVTAFRQAEGRVDSVLAVLQDITKRRRAEEESRRLNAELEMRVHERTAELEAANAELVQANEQLSLARQDLETSLLETTRAKEAADSASRAKSEFLAIMSHEIRTPINGVMGMLTLLKGSPLAAEQLEMAEMALESAEVLLGVLNDILDFSRIEAGKMAFEELPFDLFAVTREVSRLLAPGAQEKGLDLGVDLDLAAPRYVVGDAGRVRQVLVNLAGNAVKFTPRGRVTIRVCPGKPLPEPQASSRATILVSVDDTGIGIPPDKLPYVFDRFTQADPGIARRFGGTGLGLAICRELVTRMGGRIGVDSQPGKGSSFWFELELPVASPDALGTPAADAAASPSPPPPALPRASFHVLVAEDNVINKKVAVGLLERLGCRVDTASNGEEVLRMLASAPYDLVFMDCQMPEMDGFEATEQIRRREAPDHHVPIVAMTAQAMRGDRERCLSAGMDDYVSKPLSPAMLRDIIERWAHPSGLLRLESPPALPAEDRGQAPMDMGVLEGLLGADEDEDRQMVRNFVGLFEKDTAERVAAMRRAVAKGDAVLLGRQAHAVKGSSLALKASDMVETCVRLQQVADSGTMDQAEPLLVHLEEAARRVHRAMEEYVGQLTR